MANIKGVQTIDGVWIINSDTDPTIGVGLSAPQGSIVIASDGSGTFYKTGASNTDYSNYLSSPRWIKVTKTFADFATAGLTNDIEIYSLPAGYMLQGVLTKHNTSFSGGLIVAYTISVGIAGNLIKYSTAFSVITAVSDTNFQVSNNFVIEDWGNAKSIRASAISVGANLNSATQGEVEIYLLISKVKF